MIFWIAQIIGVIALLMVIVSFQQRTQKRIMFFQLFSTALFVVHFSLLGLYTGSILNAVAFFRSLVYYNKEKKWGNTPLWPAVFTAVSVVAGIVTWDGALSLLPMLAMVLSSVSTWLSSAKLVRIFNLPGSAMWMVYNFAGQSYPGAVTEIISTVSVIVGIIRLDLRKNKDVTPNR